MSLAADLRAMFRGAADEALRQVAHDTLDRARADAPPSPADNDPDPATSLRDAGTVERRGSGRYRISFDTEYAAKQHEDMRLDHPHGGGSKFLEKNVLIAARELEGKVAIELKKAMRSRGRHGSKSTTSRLG